MHRSLIILFLLQLLIFAPAAPAAEIAPETLQKLLDLSGATEQFASFPAAAEAGIEQMAKQDGSLPAKQVAILKKLMGSALVPAEIIDVVKKGVQKTISEEEARELLVWYESEDGRKITKAEEEASTPEAIQTMLGDADRLLADTPMVDYAIQLDKLLNATEKSLKLQELIAAMVFTGLSQVTAPGEPLDVARFKAEMAAIRKQMEPQMKQMITLSTVYTYRSFDKELRERYVSFITKPAHQKFQTLIEKGITYAFKKAARKLVEHFTASPGK